MYPTLTVNISIWLLASTALGPVAMGIMASFAAGAIVAPGFQLLEKLQNTLLVKFVLQCLQLLQVFLYLVLL